MVAAHLHKQGNIIIPYLDDCLLKAPTWTDAVDITHRTLDLFLRLGFTDKHTKINCKSHSEVRLHRDASQLSGSQTVIANEQVQHSNQPHH